MVGIKYGNAVSKNVYSTYEFEAKSWKFCVFRLGNKIVYIFIAAVAELRSKNCGIDLS
jgi:hypothetical protein